MVVRFQSEFLDVAMSIFKRNFSHKDNGTVFGYTALHSIHQTGVEILFPTDNLYRDVMAWGTGALDCELIINFHCERV